MSRPAAPRERGPAYLSVIANHTEVQKRPLTAPITLGRNLDCDLWVEDALLSRRHCRIEPALEGDGWIITDLSSRNGTFVNGERVLEPQALNHRDVITIGRTRVKFHAYGYVPPRPADPTAALLLPSRAHAALSGRAPTPHQSNRPLPSPKVAGNDSTVTPSPGETLSGDRTLAFTRPPARPIIKPSPEET